MISELQIMEPPPHPQALMPIKDSDHPHWALLVACFKGGDFRDRITRFEEALGDTPGSFAGDTDNCPLKHHFANGIYVREILIPRGCLYVGRIHKFDHPRVLLSGELSVASEFTGFERVRGPLFQISRAGTKRIGYAHTDVVMLTIHRTEERDVAKLPDEITVATYEEFEALAKQPKALSCPS